MFETIQENALYWKHFITHFSRLTSGSSGCFVYSLTQRSKIKHSWNELLMFIMGWKLSYEIHLIKHLKFKLWYNITKDIYIVTVTKICLILVCIFFSRILEKALVFSFFFVHNTWHAVILVPWLRNQTLALCSGSAKS